MDNKKNDKKRWHNKPHMDNKKKERIQAHSITAENKEAIRVHKLNIRDCRLCSEPITELSSALADKMSGEPVHFDCVLKRLQAQETLADGQKITYIGQGRFAVTFFENPHDLRKFTIIRIIEWEERDSVHEWRTEIKGLYSQIK